MVRNVQRVSVMSPAMEGGDRIVRGEEPDFTTMRTIRNRHPKVRRMVVTNRSTDQLSKVLKAECERRCELPETWKHIALGVRLVGTCSRLDYITASDASRILCHYK